MRRAWAALGAITLLALSPARAGEGFKRIPFDFSVPLGEGAPGLAAEGDRVAFADGAVIKFVDSRSGEALAECSAIPEGSDPGGQISVMILGMRNGRAYACVRHLAGDEIPNPAEGAAVIGRTGPREGYAELVSVQIGKRDAVRLRRLPIEAQVAKRLLDNHAVFCTERELFIVPLEGAGKERRLRLPAPAVFRPSVRGDRILGFCTDSAYRYRVKAGKLERIPFKGTALSPLVQMMYRNRIEEADGILLYKSREEIGACDSDGKLLWKRRHYGCLAVDDKGRIYVVHASLGDICRLAPKDGRILWRRTLSGTRAVRGAEILDDRLVIFSGGMLTVLDTETGKVLMDLPQKRRLVRRAYGDGTSLVRIVGAGNTVAIAFENHVYGVDLTPTAEIPAKFQASDPANAVADLTALEGTSPRSARYGDTLAKIGRNMADTPELAARVKPRLRPFTALPPEKLNASVLVAFHWLDDPMIPQAMLKFLRAKRYPGTGTDARIVYLLGSHPNGSLVKPLLREIIGAQNDFDIRIREIAAQQLNLMEKPEAFPKGLLGLLYGGDHEAAVAEFSRRLREGNAKERAVLLKALEQGPDEVLVELSGVLGGLPTAEEREQGAELARGAEARLAAIKRFQKKLAE